jgi:hypothetical protein
VLALDVESHLELGAVKSKGVGVLHIYDQIQFPSGHADAADYHPLQLNVRFLENLTNRTAGTDRA